jgi:GST-like protein
LKRSNYCSTNNGLLPILKPSEQTTNYFYTTMTDQDEKKTEIVAFPEGYEVPKQWAPKTMGGVMGKMNQPSAGKRFESELPRGEHGLQLYSLGTPNGHKVTILLEELGIDYDAYKINILELEQFGSAFVDINPNSKIPALLDYSVADGKSDEPLRLFESASIMLYLAEKEQKFIPTDLRKKTECMNWLMWQMGTAPSLGGGFGHFYNYAPLKIEYAIDRFSMETKRIVDVLDKHLENKEFVCDDEYTIADMAIFPWIRCLDKFYNATEFLQLEEYTNVQRWIKTIEVREAVQRGLRVNGWGPDAVSERHSIDDFAAATKEDSAEEK